MNLLVACFLLIAITRIVQRWLTGEPPKRGGRHH